MPSFRCYFLDYQGHIGAAENFDAEHLDEAIERALAMLKARPHHHSIEIWQRTLRLYASREKAPRHQCHIYEGSPSQTLPAMAAVITRELRAKSRCMYLNSPPMVSGLKFYLASAGLDVEQETAKGSLILSSDREHLIEGVFDPDHMLTKLEQAVEDAEQDGYRGLWATGDMTWELGPQQCKADLLRYECRLEEVFKRRPALSGICQYHVDTLPRDALRQSVLAHPGIFISETLSRVNHYYVPPPSCGRPGIDNGVLDQLINALTGSALGNGRDEL